jgi:CheY-like chemotaxis protein
MGTSSGRCQGRVLYVDDDEALIFLTTRALERRDFRVFGCTSGADAVKYFSEHPDDFDVVITDIWMIGMSGAEVSQRVRSIRPDIPIIMASGCLRAEDHKMAERLQINQLVQKPDTVDELAQLISATMNQCSPDGEPARAKESP